jgi:hypothetical protein
MNEKQTRTPDQIEAAWQKNKNYPAILSNNERGQRFFDLGVTARAKVFEFSQKSADADEIKKKDYYDLKADCYRTQFGLVTGLLATNFPLVEIAQSDEKHQKSVNRHEWSNQIIELYSVLSIIPNSG